MFNFIHQYFKRILEIVGILLGIVVSYYELSYLVPSEPLIILEVEKKTPSTYSLTGAISDKDYSLKWVKLFPYSAIPVKQATFKYDQYTKEIDLTKSLHTTPYNYQVSKELLQNEFNQNNHFAFIFLDKDRFTFTFQFEDEETESVIFKCQILTKNDQEIPCEVKESGYRSLFRGIPWYLSATLIAILLIVFIEVVDLIRKQKINRRGLQPLPPGTE